MSIYYKPSNLKRAYGESVLPFKISFVVIAKDEIATIEKCISSIMNIGSLLNNYEIIFVDSSSSDGTLEKVLAIKNDKIQIFQITKNPNAARARNIGAKYTKFEYIFFVDGDVELCLEFVEAALDEMRNSNEIGCVHGQLEEVQYDIDYKKIIRVIKDRKNIKKNCVKKKLGGGIFLTKKTIFQNLQGFDERFDVNEDWDFMIRLSNKYKIVSLPKKMGVHHTIPYRNIKKIRNTMLNCDSKFTGFLIRKRLFSFNDVVCIIKADYGNIMGGLIWFIVGLSFLIHCSILGIICLLLFLVDIFLGLMKEPNNLIGRLISHYVFPWIILFGLFFWFPREKRSEWIKLK